MMRQPAATRLVVVTAVFLSVLVAAPRSLLGERAGHALCWNGATGDRQPAQPACHASTLKRLLPSKASTGANQMHDCEDCCAQTVQHCTFAPVNGQLDN